MKKYIINSNDCDQRLDKFITKVAPLLPKTLMYKAIRTKKIKINGKRGEISTRLQLDDVIEIYLNDELLLCPDSNMAFLSAPYQVDVVYEDDNILLANKPVGLVVHEDESGVMDTLINRITHYLYKQKEYDPQQENSFAPALCNRIDRNTSGIVICAKNAPTLRMLNQKIKDREIDKQYKCLVFGTPKPAHKLCKAFLRKDSDQNQVRVFPHPVDDGKTILTEYTVVASNGAFSMLNIVLHTGRTHQIRAHMAYLGYPLVGDTKYGNGQENKALPFRFQALCAYSLGFVFKSDSGHLAYLNNKVFTVKDIGFSLDSINS